YSNGPRCCGTSKRSFVRAVSLGNGESVSSTSRSGPERGVRANFYETSKERWTAAALGHLFCDNSTAELGQAQSYAAKRRHAVVMGRSPQGNQYARLHDHQDEGF